MSGATLRLEIGPVAHGGHCVARHDGRVVFVRHTLPGEVVEARVTEAGESASYWRADAVSILEPAPERVESPWPEAGPGGVGGGELAHVSLAAQRGWKLAVLRESFERFAGMEFPGEVRAAPHDEARAGLRWRTRVAAVGDAEGRAAMHVFRSKDTRTLDAMPLAVEDAEAALLGQRFAAGAHISVVAPSTGGAAAVLVDGVPWRSGRADRRDNAPASVHEAVEVAGQRYEYRVATGGFWQVHRDAPAVLIGEVLQRVGAEGAVLDLYAGAGLFTLPLAAQGRRVTSVESDPRAVRSAKRNLHAHREADVVEGDVRETLKRGIGRYDAVVLDPPRAGAGRATIDALSAVEATTLVYVACDPVALARDAALLGERGYDLVDAQAWDLFPMTHHVEAVATFRRR